MEVLIHLVIMGCNSIHAQIVVMGGLGLHWVRLYNITLLVPFPTDEDMSSMGTTTIGEWHRDPRDQHRYPNRDGGPKLIRFELPRWRPKSSSSSSPSPSAVHTKINAQVAYVVHFGHSLYGWKDNFKELPMAPVSGQNSFEVNGNCQNKRTSRICHGAATPSFGLLAHVSCWGPLWWGFC